MQGRRLVLATRSRRRYRRFPQLFSGCREGSLHSSSRLGRLELRNKRIEFEAERIKPCLAGARQRVEGLDGDHHGLGNIVLRDHDSAALNGQVQDSPELAFRLTRAH
jgi:hypothetical protein